MATGRIEQIYESQAKVVMELDLGPVLADPDPLEIWWAEVQSSAAANSIRLVDLARRGRLKITDCDSTANRSARVRTWYRFDGVTIRVFAITAVPPSGRGAHDDPLQHPPATHRLAQRHPPAASIQSTNSSRLPKV